VVAETARDGEVGDSMCDLKQSNEHIYPSGVTSHAVLDLRCETLAVTPLSMPNLKAEASTTFNFLALRLKDGYAMHYLKASAQT